MNDKLIGFVLAVNDYKDSDTIAKVITKEYGILSLIGKSAKKLNAKNRMMPLCTYEFIIDYKDGKDIYSTHSLRLLSSYYDEKDLKLLSFKNIIAEAVLKSQELFEPRLYDETLFFYSHFNQKDLFILGSLFFSYLLKLYGISPHVDSCSICGNEKVVAISASKGGFLCHNHLYGEKVQDVLTLKKFRLAFKGSIDYYDIIKKTAYREADFFNLTDFFIANAEIGLRSYIFYRSI